MKKHFNKANIAYYASVVLSTVATIIVTPYCAGIVHQPKVPQELYK